MFSTLKKPLLNIRTSLLDMHRHKFVPYHCLLNRLLRNRTLPYRKYTFTDLLRCKTSDTIFILGSGPSLNSLTSAQWQEVAGHDSFGLNFSILKPHIPTFYQPSYHRRPLGQKMFLQSFQPLREKYSHTVWLLSTKARNRFIHPRITPELFPINPIIYQYSLPAAINKNLGEEFTDEDFHTTLYYRGTLTLVLDFVVKLGYKKIVLLGVDPDTWEDFFTNLPEMRDYVDEHRAMAKRIAMKFESMVPKANKGVPIDQYYYAVSEYLQRNRKIDLAVGFKECVLCPKIPAYFS